jgi:hypothetical protein
MDANVLLLQGMVAGSNTHDDMLFAALIARWCVAGTAVR